MRRTALLLAIACCITGCDDHDGHVRAMTGGDPARGPELIFQYGCGACHEVRGVPGATGKAGPPLTGVADRAYIAGRLTNSPDNMVRFIRDPHGVDPKTAMVDTGISEADARHIVAYLYALR